MFMRDEQHHMMSQFKWSNEDEDEKYFQPDEEEIEELRKKQDIRKMMAQKVEVP